MDKRKISKGLALLACVVALALPVSEAHAADYTGNTELLALRLMNMNRDVYNGNQTVYETLSASDKGADVFGMDYSKILAARVKLETALNLRNKQYDADYEVDRMTVYNQKCIEESDALRNVVDYLGARTNLKQETLDKYADILIMEAQDRCNVKYIEDRLARYEKERPTKWAAGQDSMVAGAKRNLALRKAMLPAWTAQEAAILSGREYPDLEYPENSVMDNVLSRVRYAKELDVQGYFDTEAAWQQSLLPMYQADELPSGKKFTVDGELRWDHSFNSRGEDKDKLRLRLYGDYNIDNNWHFKTRLTSEHWFKGTPWSSSAHNKVKIDRGYLEGVSGITRLNIGWFGLLLGEGNIYDSDFKGVEANVAQEGSPMEYRATAGVANDTHYSYSLEALYKKDLWRFGAGYFHFSQDDETDRNIFMFNTHYMLGDYDLSLMQLYGQNEGRNRTSGYGFVAGVSLGNATPDTPGSSKGYIKYYYQPKTTYLQHTMNGMADNLNGFRGIGIGYERAIMRNILASIEYDWLTDMDNEEKYRTLWLAITWYFGG